MKKYKCKLCGQIFEVAEGTEPVCPICKATGDELELIEETPKSKYAGTQTEKNLEAAFAGESQASIHISHLLPKKKDMSRYRHFS